MSTRSATFADFYPYSLTQHADRRCRRAHFIGTSSAIASIAQYIDSLNAWWLLFAVVSGYGGARVGPLFYRKKKTAPFSPPRDSFRGHWGML